MKKQEIKVGDYVVCTCGAGNCPSGVVLRIDGKIIWINENKDDTLHVSTAKKLTKLEKALR